MRLIFKTKNGNKGFTMIEIIAVMIIMGILAAIAISRSVNYDAEVYTSADALKSHLRYAQTMAMNYSYTATAPGVWGISGTTNSYWLFEGTSAAIVRPLPEDDTFINTDRINLTAKKVKLTAGFTVYFDNRGIPYTAYTSATTNTPLATTLTINVQPISATTPNIAVTITPLTGYIP
ncbi:MAG: hypothetical protein CVU52_00030 [Deltaproteobacteria bacterium HGW-Deltaproteobacteria-10]|nr:MAG: hypothetical protein CVU52_00030 [Deltaproteobacteria bacterium HGW-Deltaproteobacteria-10]